MTTRRAGAADGDAAHAAHHAGNEALERTMSGDTFVAPLNVIKTAMQAAAYDDGTQEQLLWFVGYVRDGLGASRRAAEQAVGYSYTTIYRVLRGEYGASLDDFLEAVRRLRAQVAARAGVDYVETCVTRRMWAELDYCRDQNAMIHISGVTGRGKSYVAQLWQRHNNHGRALYIDVPVLSGLRPLLVCLARAAGINTSRKTSDIAERVEASFDRRNVIVIDEVARLFPHYSSSIRALEFLRRMHDNTHVGLAFLTTPQSAEELRTPRYQVYLEQFLGRMEDPLILPSRLLADEAGAIAEAFGGEPEKALIHLMTETDKAQAGHLRTLFRLMRAAKLLADSRGERLAERHLKVAIAHRDGRHRWPEA